MNRRITIGHAKRVVRRCWKLYLHWQESKHPIDEEIYLRERRYAENALALRPKWKKEMPLP